MTYANLHPNDYVIKSPHGLARLAAAVRVALEQGRLRREARECRARCRNFFDGIPIGLYLASPDRRFLEVNLALVEMLGYPDRASLLQVKPSRVFADAAAEEKLWLSLERRDGVVRALEGAARRRDGSTIRVRRSAGPAWSAEGRVAYYHFSVDEVSPRAGVHAAPAAESGTQADGAPCPPGSRRQGQIV
ncbi:MAG: PAS domain S-box protein [Thermoanaerobaculia bacterium]